MTYQTVMPADDDARARTRRGAVRHAVRHALEQSVAVKSSSAPSLYPTISVASTHPSGPVVLRFSHQSHVGVSDTTGRFSKLMLLTAPRIAQ